MSARKRNTAVADPGLEPYGNEVTRLVEGRSDEQVISAVKKRGIDNLLSWVFGLIAEAYIPGSALVESAIVQFDITAPDGVHSYQLEFSDDKCVVLKVKGEAARVTISLALPVFLRIVGGELDGMNCFVNGKLRLAGDVLMAQAMRGWFDRQSAVAVTI
jgi:SCP-2 sterol transfer family protein